MMNAFFTKHRFALTWIALAFLIKGILFALFAVLFHQNWPQYLMINSIFVGSGDTSSYYEPVEAFVNNGSYSSYCRMPGLLPIYAPLYFLFGEVWGKTLVIMLQFMVSTVSVYLLAQTAVMAFKNKQFFYVTFFLYAISSFVSNWDHYGLSDSFGTSFLIISVYYLLKFKEQNKTAQLLLSGLFITWSVFFRPAHGILVPILVLAYLTDLKQLAGSFKHILLFCLPFVLALGLWTYSNYSKYQRIIVLQGPMSECFGNLTPELLSIRGLIIGWGGDYQPWSKGSEAEWFFDNSVEEPSNKAIRESYLTTRYNYNSLLLLRQKYMLFMNDTLPAATKKLLSQDIINTSEQYLDAYKKEHAFDFYIGNKAKLLKQLLLPNRLDDMPTPKFSEMNIFHKLLKGFYFLLLLFINVVGFASCLFYLSRKNRLTLVPLTLVVLIGCVLGFVEQRYLVPAYPYLLLFAAAPMVWLWQKFGKKQPVEVHKKSRP